MAHLESTGQAVQWAGGAGLGTWAFWRNEDGQIVAAKPVDVMGDGYRFPDEACPVPAWMKGETWQATTC